MKSNGLGVGACTSISRNDIDTVSYSGWRYGTGLLQIISSSEAFFQHHEAVDGPFVLLSKHFAHAIS